jgi:hypothetical protein
MSKKYAFEESYIPENIDAEELMNQIYDRYLALKRSYDEARALRRAMEKRLQAIQSQREVFVGNIEKKKNETLKKFDDHEHKLRNELQVLIAKEHNAEIAFREISGLIKQIQDNNK